MRSKSKKPTSPTVTLASPSSVIADPDLKPLIDIPEDEQWRIINQTGILNKLQENDRAESTVAPPEATLGDEIFNTLLYTIPLSTLLLIMEMCVFLSMVTWP
jgi:hypothetical protein